MKKIAVIIPTYNSVDHVSRCLDALLKNDYPAYSVVVVDDNSSDRTKETVNLLYPRAVVLTGTGDLWWSGSINLGLEYCRKQSFDGVILLNDDNIVGPDFVAGLAAACDRHPHSIIGSIVVSSFDSSKTIFCGGSYSKLTATFSPYEAPLDQAECYRTEFMGGMGIYMPLDLIDSVGFFDEANFPQYSGDQDYWLRAIKAGVGIFISPRSVIKVDPSKTGFRISNIGILRILPLMFHKKYHNNIITRLKFLYRHSYRSLIPFNLFYFYIFYFLKLKLKK